MVDRKITGWITMRTGRGEIKRIGVEEGGLLGLIEQEKSEVEGDGRGRTSPRYLIRF